MTGHGSSVPSNSSVSSGHECTSPATPASASRAALAAVDCPRLVRHPHRMQRDRAVDQRGLAAADLSGVSQHPHRRRCPKSRHSTMTDEPRGSPDRIRGASEPRDKRELKPAALRPARGRRAHRGLRRLRRRRFQPHRCRQRRRSRRDRGHRRRRTTTSRVGPASATGQQDRDRQTNKHSSRSRLRSSRHPHSPFHAYRDVTPAGFRCTGCEPRAGDHRRTARPATSADLTGAEKRSLSTGLLSRLSFEVEASLDQPARSGSELARFGPSGRRCQRGVTRVRIPQRRRVQSAIVLGSPMHLRDVVGPATQPSVTWPTLAAALVRCPGRGGRWVAGELPSARLDR